MALPFLSFFKKQPPKEYFLAFLLRDEHVHAVVFEQLNGRIQVVGQGKSPLSTSLESVPQEELLTAADKAISIAEEALPNGVQTHKTVFGVKETWVEDTKIKKDYLAKLKYLSDELELQPIGFLVFPEAIAHLLQTEEGAPISAILLDIGTKFLSATLIRAGRIIESHDGAIQESLPEVIENTLKKFANIEIFPSRIILFDTQNKDIESKLVRFQWSKSLPFLHVPQITTLSSDFDTRAILYGTATQMGFDAVELVRESKNKQIDKYPNKQMIDEESKGPKEPEELKVERSEDRGETEDEIAKENFEEVETTRHAELDSTSQEEEIADQVRNDEKVEPEEVSKSNQSDYFGFVKDSDIADTDLPKKTSQQHPSGEMFEDEMFEREEAAPLGVSAADLAGQAKRTISKLLVRFPKMIGPLGKSLRQIIQERKLPSNGLLLLIPGVLILIVISIILYIFGTKAQVILSFNPKIIEQTQSVTFSTTQATDASQNIIGADSLSVDENGKVTVNATGKKDVGDKAKGTVTIFNSDDSSHTLKAGTTITSSNSLKFTLDNDVTVASGSSDPTNLSAGTADVSVTAADIGTDYNLPSSTKFTISGTSVMAAKNANAFSGGSKKSITVVSQADLDNATDQLTKTLSDKAKSDIQQKVASDETILPEFTKTSLSNTSYDKKVGDQADSTTLNGTVTYQTVVYKKSDIDSYTKAIMGGQLPSGMTLSSQGISYDVKDLTVKDGSAKATLDIKAPLLPSIDVNSLTQQIAGKSFADAREILTATPQFGDVTFQLSPNLFFLPKTLPRISSHITISSKSL